MYVSRQVVFLEHIPFYFLSSDSNTRTKYELTYIDPFPFDDDVSSDYTIENFRVDTNSTIDINVSSIPTNIQQRLAVVDLTTYTPSSSLSFVIINLVNLLLNIYSPYFSSFLISIHNLYEPSSYNEVILDHFLQQIMIYKLVALHKTYTWDLIPLPSRKYAIGSCWVYKTKTKSNGSVERQKARPVAKGFSQQYDMNYEETFSPVAKMTTIYILIVVAYVHQWNIY